ncbi:hypothetical protein COT50_00295 [candidate division WWE3 bacterium CG08_land_8_20_14_0_20_41_10]|uniref:Homing endonuclease LAGLIDADG domain-containing protein n=1 Tax=candidate division WWE3 bacterium CG08_land_8_20_14_0_20_41_10 TaxID=1975085 RepID=A0A2H0XCS9_UNCKA|nr:MAG: hypothetical protein COT50_00295 [candidate division WWE3 bacterium CG08_land_8_20_14_0_20_41_10]
MVLKTNKQEMIWLAGFIDGEGYIGINRQRKKETAEQSASLLYHPYLIIANSNYNALENIKDYIGYGHIYEVKRKKSKSRHKNEKPGFQYKLTKMDKLKPLLKALRPYLRLKQKQCDLLLNFINIRKKAKRIYGPFRGASSYTSEEKIYQKLRTLNKRGS